MSKALAKNEKRYYGTGGRKTSVARVFIKKGTGQLTINDQSLAVYFPRRTAQVLVRQPLVLLGVEDKFDIKITVKGGGIMGQAAAIRHGLSRALIAYDEEGEAAPKRRKEVEGGAEIIELSETSFRRKLRKVGYVTRDARIVERKKVGRHKARKGVQFSKR